MTVDARERFAELTERWGVQVERTVTTPTSLLGFGTRRGSRVVLKVVRAVGEEWNAGAVAAAFAGHGTVRVYEHMPGASLLEELVPGTPLVDSIAADGDDQATDVLARVIGAMAHARPSVHGHPTAEQWGKAFPDYRARGDYRLATALVEEAHGVYMELCRTQRRPRLLHGDLHHDNVLRDEVRGWLAIDPKGVVAEVEFELGAALRNPRGRGDLLAAPAVERRIHRFARVLPVDAERVARWAFAQAVLSEIWTVEDGGTPDPAGAALRLAQALRPHTQFSPRRPP